jgi:SAM-dependent methyltransferase
MPDMTAIKDHWSAYIYNQQENQTDDVIFLLGVLGKNPQKILEVCCGGGRILVPLAKAGHDVTGFDMDENMMSMIPEKINGLKNIRYYQADALKEDWGKDYDVVVLAGNIMINIVTGGSYEEAQKLFIKKAYAAVKQGGHIYLDFDLHAHPEEVFNSGEESIIFEGYDDAGVYGKYLLRGGVYDKNTQMTAWKHSTEIILQNGEKHMFEGASEKYIPTLKDVYEWLRHSPRIGASRRGTLDLYRKT